MKNSNLSSLTTERRNEKTKQIHQAETFDILRIINGEDKKVAEAVEAVLPDVKIAVDYAVDSLKKGGRIIYIGARYKRAARCTRCGGMPADVQHFSRYSQGLIAGGEKALFEAVEGAEDREELGMRDLKAIHLSNKDTVIGIAASGRTPYVHGALTYARKTGAKTISLTCNKQSAISKAAAHSIEVIVGPEVVAGSTRMKAATAHKMILNMISTTAMIQMGKVYENLMVDVNVSNEKLKQRAIRIIQAVTGAEQQTAEKTLESAEYHVKTAIIMLKTNTEAAVAQKLLKQAEGNIEKAISIHKGNA
ncbi:N-acetylmuramic acid 6-phosphate etherase [Bacillus sonorensis]|nr:N-acetylmuramic acid 6-phosphate etherase [Bacillus sonorensis]